MENAQILHDLQLAIERLADAVANEPPVAGALRRFAATLTLPSSGSRAAARSPARSDGPRDPTAIRGLLYRALDDGTLDARRFDWLMLARTRASRMIARRQGAVS